MLLLGVGGQPSLNEVKQMGNITTSISKCAPTLYQTYHVLRTK